MKKMILVAGLMSLSMIATASFADGAKIGVVNVKQIFNTSSKVTSQKQKLLSKFSGKRAQLKVAQGKMQKMIADYKRNASVMSASQKKQLQTQVAAQQSTIVQMSQKFQMEAMRAQSQAMKKFVGQLHDAAKAVAKKDGLQMIVPSHSAIYSASDLDVTKQVEKAFNAS